MSRPRMTVAPAAPAGQGADRSWGGWLGLWRRWATLRCLRRGASAALPALSDHLRRDLGLPALAYRHGLCDHAGGIAGLPRPPWGSERTD